MLISDLIRLGVPSDKPVMVHTSLRRVGARGEVLLEALREHVTRQGGILLIPTHTWANLYGEHRLILDRMCHKTSIGALPDLAAAHGDAIITENPTHSVAMFGAREKIEPVLKLENEADTPTSPQGVYGFLARQEGFVLLLGVGQESNTYLHSAEEMLLGRDRLKLQPTVMRVRRESGEVMTRSFYELDEEKWGDVSRQFPKLEEAFCFWKCIRTGTVGNASAQLCDAEGMLRVMERIYRNTDGKSLYSDATPLNPEWYQNK